MASHYQTLRDRQIGIVALRSLDGALANAISNAVSIQKILNLNHDPAPNSDEQDGVSTGTIPHNSPITREDGQPIWKVLVFDNLGRDVISTVLRVSDLRASGVTIHLYARDHSTAPFSTSSSNKLQQYQHDAAHDTRRTSNLPGRAIACEPSNHHLGPSAQLVFSRICQLPHLNTQTSS